MPRFVNTRDYPDDFPACDAGQIIIDMHGMRYRTDNQLAPHHAPLGFLDTALHAIARGESVTIYVNSDGMRSIIELP